MSEHGWSADVPVQTGPDEYIVVCRGPGGARRVVWGTAPYEVAERADRECDEHNERERRLNWDREPPPAWLPEGWTWHQYVRYGDFNIVVCSKKGFAIHAVGDSPQHVMEKVVSSLKWEYPLLIPEEAT